MLNIKGRLSGCLKFIKLRIRIPQNKIIPITYFSDEES